MNHRLLCIPPTALLVAAAFAQDPAPAAPPTLALQSLQALLTETVYTRHATATPAATPATPPAGSAADTPFARVRDASLDADGRLVHLIVEAPPTAAGRDATARLLPAAAVQWDTTTRRWLTAEPTLQWASLAPHAPAEPGKEKEKDAANPGNPQPLLASDLLRATLAGDPKDKPVAAEASQRQGERPPAPCLVCWLAPSARQLAFATVSKDGRHLAMPWPTLRTTGSGEHLQVHLTSSAALLAKGPCCPDATQPPSPQLRQMAYEHYGVPVPKWDRLPLPGDADHAGKTAGKERGKG